MLLRCPGRAAAARGGAPLGAGATADPNCPSCLRRLRPYPLRGSTPGRCLSGSIARGSRLELLEPVEDGVALLEERCDLRVESDDVVLALVQIELQREPMKRAGRGIGRAA